MAMLDGMRAVFLEALSFVDEKSRAILVKQWNEQCEAVYKYKQDLIAEEQAKATAYGKSVAREIFEKIEGLMWDAVIGGKYPAKVINPDKFAELKKKYESEGADDDV